MASAKIGIVEKVGYSLGDGAANFVFMTMILFQSAFYTDVMGIAAGTAGTLLLVGRVWDAFFDPVMGVVADRTNTRWGKFRPWVLWTAVPWALVMILAFTVPGLKGTSLVIYATVTNIMLMTLYSANNTPYSALGGVMTGDVNERNVLSSYRFFAAMVAQLVVGTFTLSLVAKFGQGDAAKGWQTTMGLWAVICLVSFIVTFLVARERIQPPPTQQSNPREDFANLLKNGPWIAMFVLTLAHFIYVSMRGGIMYHYFHYYLNGDALYTFLDGFGMGGGVSAADHPILNAFGLIVNDARTNVADVANSVFNFWSQFVTIIGVIASTFLAMKFGKKTVALACFALTTVFLASFVFLPADGIGATFALEGVRALAYSPTIPLIWAMFADVADYTEWTTGRRITGVIFATILFGLKLGLSLGGALMNWALAFFGYQANAAQTDSTLLGIRLTASVFPAIFLVIVVACVAFYKIDKKLNLQIQDELAERRKAFAGDLA